VLSQASAGRETIEIRSAINVFMSISFQVNEFYVD
jgi:hypothetical protein